MPDKKILVVVDPTSDKQPALERATVLAERLSAELELFICHYDPDIAARRYATVWIDHPAREELVEILEKKLDSLAAPLRQRGLTVSTDVQWDHPFDDGIVHRILTTQPWMVVKDARHHNVFRRTILSNTDWSLIRRCPAPLLLVKRNPSRAPAKICAAVDPTHEHDKPADLDTAIYRLASVLAEATGAELHVVHTYATKAEPVGLEAPAVGKLADAIRSEHERIFKAFLKKCPVPAERAHLLKGLAHERLVDFTTREQIGMVVMGAVSRRGLDRIFVGATAERVLDRLPCDLLIVKPERVIAALSEQS